MKNYLLISALLCVSMSAIAWEIISGPPLQPSQVMKERLGSDRRYAILYNILENPYVNPETPKIEPYEKPSYVTRVDLNTGEHEAIVFDLPLGDVYDLIEALWDPFNNQTYLTIKARISDFYDWCIITLDEKTMKLNMGDTVALGLGGGLYLPPLRYRFNPDYIFSVKEFYSPGLFGNYNEEVKIFDRMSGNEVRSWTFRGWLSSDGVGTNYAGWIGGHWLMIIPSKNPIEGLPVIKRLNASLLKRLEEYVVYDFVRDQLVDFGDEIPVGYGKNTVISVGMDNIGFTVWTVNGEILFRDSEYNLTAISDAATEDAATGWGGPGTWTIYAVRFDGRYVVYNTVRLSEVDACVILDLLEGDTKFVRGGNDAEFMGLF